MSSNDRDEERAWLVGSTTPTSFERTMAPGVALLIVTSALLVGGYLLFLLIV